MPSASNTLGILPTEPSTAKHVDCKTDSHQERQSANRRVVGLGNKYTIIGHCLSLQSTSHCWLLRRPLGFIPRSYRLHRRASNSHHLGVPRDTLGPMEAWDTILEPSHAWSRTKTRSFVWRKPHGKSVPPRSDKCVTWSKIGTSVARNCCICLLGTAGPACR